MDSLVMRLRACYSMNVYIEIRVKPMNALLPVPLMVIAIKSMIKRKRHFCDTARRRFLKMAGAHGKERLPLCVIKAQRSWKIAVWHYLQKVSEDTGREKACVAACAF